jgi:hypothetical protein
VIEASMEPRSGRIGDNFAELRLLDRPRLAGVDGRSEPGHGRREDGKGGERGAKPIGLALVALAAIVLAYLDAAPILGFESG